MQKFGLLIGLLAFLNLVSSEDCLPEEFQCNNGKCVSRNHLCDGYDDCGDVSDEQANCPPCPADRFECRNGMCIHPTLVCNNNDNCGDNSDEIDDSGNCPHCPVASYQCPNTGKCILRSWTCDGLDHCGDRSDETEEACPCTDDEIRCGTPDPKDPPGKCIPPERICDEDGIWDCPWGEDEKNCTTTILTM